MARDGTHAEAIARLLAGVKGFRALYYEQRPENIESLIRQGQKPKVMIVACSDSRVDPAILTNSLPGELFVVRNVANLIPPYHPDGDRHGTSAALEFAVCDLEVEHIVVLGHALCGGVRALSNTLVGNPPEREFIGPWMSIVTEACHSHHDHGEGARGVGVPAELTADNVQDLSWKMEQLVVRVSCENLLSFPWVRQRVREGTLAVHGWWFDLTQGRLWRLDPETMGFNPIE